MNNDVNKSETLIKYLDYLNKNYMEDENNTLKELKNNLTILDMKYLKEHSYSLDIKKYWENEMNKKVFINDMIENYHSINNIRHRSLIKKFSESHIEIEWIQKDDNYLLFKENMIISLDYIYFDSKYRINCKSYQTDYFDICSYENYTLSYDHEKNYYYLFDYLNELFYKQIYDDIDLENSQLIIKLIYDDNTNYLYFNKQLDDELYKELINIFKTFIPFHFPEPYFFQRCYELGKQYFTEYFEDVDTGKIVRKQFGSVALEYISKDNPYWTETEYNSNYEREYYFGGGTNCLFKISIDDVINYFDQWGIDKDKILENELIHHV